MLTTTKNKSGRRARYATGEQKIQEFSSMLNKIQRHLKTSLRWKTHAEKKYQQKQKLLFVNSTNIYWKLERKESMNLQILLTWTKQGHNLKMIMGKLMTQLTQKLSGVS